jgi:hypothetical protein
LFCFPTGTQHVSTHPALEVAKVTESVIPTHRLDCGIASFIGGCHAFFILVFKQPIEIATIDISI